jgi:hypothetical protein
MPEAYSGTMVILYRTASAKNLIMEAIKIEIIIMS